MAYVEQYEVESLSTPGKVYRVSLDANGQWSCACRGWCTHVPRRDCQHIEQVRRLGPNHRGVTAVDPMLAAMFKAERRLERQRAKAS